jgi:diguanylate cyclase (GGDEF)-like protein/hemerythrin-like metal-binding protein
MTISIPSVTGSGLILLAVTAPAAHQHIHHILHPSYRLLHTDSGDEVLPLALQYAPDVILLDLQLTPLDGYALCARLKAEAQTASVPVILLAERDVREDEVRGLELGAIDFLVKPVDSEILLARVRNHLALKRIQDHLEATNRHLESLATTDTLTGLVNRRGLLARLEAECARSQRTHHPFALAICDLDHFKRINDTYGHPAGDRVLAAFAATLKDNLRSIDLAARWGGEEFAIVLPESSTSDVLIPLERVRQATAALRIHHGQQDIQVTVSIGVASYDSATGMAEQLLERADSALYRAKANGRNRIECATPAPPEACFKLVWHSHYASGHPQIDAQHQGLFQDANELLVAILEAHPRPQILASAERLLNDVITHFQDEETILAAVGYAELEAHRAIHTSLVIQGTNLFAALQRGEGDLGAWFQFLAHEVVVRHMLQVDRDYFPLLK